MKAIRLTQYGGAESLELVDLPDPTPGPGEVTIDVTHAAVGLIDVLIRRGAFADYDLPMQPPYVPGIEVAGTIRAIGEGVTTLEVGDQVSTLSIPTGGGYAEVVVAPAEVTFALPDGVDPAQAVAALPNATTAQLALTRAVSPARSEGARPRRHRCARLGLPPIASRLGASEVVGVVRSTDRIAEAEQLGFDRVVLSEELLDALDGERFDIIVDPVGGALRGTSLQLLAEMGRLLAVGSADSGGHSADTNELWFSYRGVVGFAVGQFLLQNPAAAAPAAAAALPAIADGSLKLGVETDPLESAADAHTRMDAGGVSGRIVLTV